jgi:hypothetical protein
MSNSAAPSLVPLYAALLTGLLGFVGSWMGAQIALIQLKRERAFEKQLDWYERAIRATNQLAETIEVAGTFQDEKDIKPEALAGIWSSVQSAHLQFSRTAQEAALFGSPNAVEQIRRIDEIVQNTANESEAFDPPKIRSNERKEILNKVYDLPEELERARKGLVVEARLHLGLDPKVHAFRRVIHHVLRKKDGRSPRRQLNNA